MQFFPRYAIMILQICSDFAGMIRMKKKWLMIFLLALVTAAVLLGVAFHAGILIIEVEESPNGEYQIVSWLIDKGAWGYSGAYYIKENGLFSKWYKLGTGPFAGEWLSETEFSVYHASPIDGDWTNSSRDNHYKEYNVNEFFAKINGS